MANLHEKIEKNSHFIDAIDYLIDMKIASSQKELAERTGIMESTFSNIRQNKKVVSDKTINKLLETFPNMFDINYFRCKSVQMIVEQPKDKNTPKQENPSNEIPTWADTFINILSKQVVENEALNRQLKAELAEVRTLRAELQQAVQAFRMAQKHKVVPYTPFTPDYEQAADPE